VLLASAPAHAQDESPLPPEAEPEVATPIPLGDIRNRADEVRADVRDVEADVEAADVENEIEAELPDLAESVEPGTAAAESLLDGRPSLSELDELERAWRATGKALATRERRLRTRVSELEDAIARFDRQWEVWRKTRDLAQRRGAPDALIADVESTLEGLAELSEILESSRNDALILQSQVAELGRLVQDTLSHIGSTRTRVVENILVRDRQPLWRTGVAPELRLRGLSLSSWLAEVREAGAEYLDFRGERLALHLLGFVALLVYLVRARTAVRRRTEEAAEDAESEPVQVAAHVLDRPISAALVLALVGTDWIHPEAPLVLHDLAGIVLLLPLVRVLRPLLGRELHPLLTALAGFYLTDQLVDLLGEFSHLVRWIFLVEMVAASIGLGWLLRTSRVARLPVGVSPTWLRLIGGWARAGLVGVVLAALGTVLGYTSAATLVGGAVLGSGYVALGLYAGARIAEGLVVATLRSESVRRVSGFARRYGHVVEQRAGAVLRVAAAVGWLYSVLDLLALLGPAGVALDRVLAVRLGYGDFALALGDLLAFGFTIWLAWALSRLVRSLLEEELYPRIDLPRGVPFALSAIGGYAILLFGFVVALGALGFDLDRVTILLGAFGVGIGFGLQTIVNNFVSGLILLFERPIQVGDRVQLADLNGLVTRIGIRASTVRTWEGADVIVPNANLISDRLVNWTLADQLRRIDLPVGVAYGTDPEHVIGLLRESLAEHPDVLSDPSLEVFFRGFGDSSLDFEVRAWTDKAGEWVRIRSELAVRTYAALNEAGVEIPFPQRDLHLRSLPPGAAGPGNAG